MSISDRLDQIEARADAATEGPWGFVADTNLIGMTKVWRVGSTEAMADVAATPRFGTDRADAEFIATARNDVPALVVALRAVLDVCAGLEEAHRADPELGFGRGMEEASHLVRNAVAAAFGCGDGIDTTPERVHETGKSEHIGEGQS